MGKVRNKCSKVARVDPTGLQKTNGEGGEEVVEDLGPVVNLVQTIQEQLQSHLVEERDSGLNSLSNASSKPAYLEEILKSDIFRTVGPLLLDSSISVRHSAAGALRNLSSINMDVCEKMIAADVLTPLVALIKNKYCLEDWLPVTKEKKSKQPFKIDSCTEAYIEAITLLSNLCEVGEISVKIFNQEKLADGLCKFLNIELYGIQVAVCTALCLYSATEDNPQAVTNKTQLEEILSKILILSKDSVPSYSYQVLYLQIAAVGILINIYEGDLKKTNPNTMLLVMQIINNTLDVNHNEELKKISSEIPISNGTHTEVYHREEGSDMKKIFEMDEKCEEIVALIDSQIMAMEILSNILIPEDGMWKDEDDDDSAEDDFQDDSIEMTNGTEEDVEMKDIYSDIPTEVYECLCSSGTITKVLNKIKSLPVNVVQIFSENELHGKNLLKKSHVLRSTALLCLQNLVDELNLTDLEKCIGIEDLWMGLGSTLTECELTDETMTEALTSAMRAIVQSIAGQKTLPHTLSSKLCSGLPIFQKVYESVAVAKIKINVIKILGYVGLVLSRFPKGTPVDNLNVEAMLTEISEYFLTCLMSLKVEKEGLWIAAEILDTLYDVFTEDDYNDVLKKVGLISKLKSIQPTFKKQVRSERKSLGENGAVITTANTNLLRFIKYKEQNGAC